MPSTIPSEVAPQAAALLVAHLRSHPDDASLPASELAGRFNLSESFVASVLEGLRERPQASVNMTAWKPSLVGVQRIWDGLRRAFDRATRDPVRFVLITSLLAFVLCVFATQAPAQAEVGVATMRITTGSSAVALIITVTLAMHMLCFAYRRMARYALYGGIMVWVITSMVSMVATWRQPTPAYEAQFAGEVLIAGMAMMVVGALYAAIGSLAAVVGAWIAYRVQDFEDERKSRQDLLERYFELQGRLMAGEAAPVVRMPLEHWAIVQRFLARPFLWTVWAAAFFWFASFVVSWVAGVDTVKMDASDPVRTALVLIYSLFLMMLSILVYIGLGFFSTNLWKALLCSLIFSGTGFLLFLLPINVPGFTTAMRLQGLQTSIAMAPIMLIFTAFGHFGGYVQRRANRDRDLQQSNQAAIVAEMLRIQWRLSEQTSSVCVVVIDAAKSSVMKAEADPLAVEYTFREYQEWLERLGGEFGGRVHSTAGDGAVIAFSEPKQALLACRRIQADVERFNREINRLKSPFRLRVGIHSGQVVGNLDEVQFTEVIDIAAHVQEVAPIGGIAVSQSFKSMLPTEDFLDLQVVTDGQQVYLALPPKP